MKKRSVSAILVIVMLFTLTISASGADMATTENFGQLTVDINEEIDRALNGETDLYLDSSDIASATLIGENGTTEKVDVYVTTRELQPRVYTNEDVHVYATTVVAQAEIKEEIGTKEKDYVTGTLTLYWTDHFGLMNDFEGLSGGWTFLTNPETGKNPSLSDRKVRLMGGGPPSMGDHDYYNDNLTSNTFNISKGAVRDGWTYYKAWSWVTINDKDVLKVSVETSVFTQ